MKRRTDKAFGINQQRGFWLRCFLEPEEAIGLLASTSYAPSSVDCVEHHPLKAGAITGVVADSFAAAIAGASVIAAGEDGQWLVARADSSSRCEASAPLGNSPLKTGLTALQSTYIEQAVTRGGRDFNSQIYANTKRSQGTRHAAQQ